MKKFILLLTLCFGFMTSSFAQNGELMTATHNVYSGITHTYKATGTDAFTWEVFSDEACTASIGAISGEYTFTGTSNLTKDLTITWNAAGTYYLRLKQDDGCINYKTLKVVVTSVDNMTFAFIDATSEDCAVNITLSNVILDVTLTGDYLIHETGKQAEIQYAIGVGTPKWINVELGSTTGAGTYTVIIPAADLLSPDAKVSKDFVINVYQLRDGNGAVNDFTATPITHTWTATALPTVDDIIF